MACSKFNIVSDDFKKKKKSENNRLYYQNILKRKRYTKIENKFYENGYVLIAQDLTKYTKTIFKKLKSRDKRLKWFMLFEQRASVYDKLKYDKYRYQIIIKPNIISEDYYDKNNIHMSNNEKKAYLNLRAAVLKIEPALNAIVRDYFPVHSKELELEHITILKSVGGGQEQQTHMDYDKNTYNERKNTCYIMILPLHELCSISVNITATIYYKECGDREKMGKKKADCEIVNVNIPMNEVLVFRGELGHYGNAYKDDNYRLHCVFFPRDGWTLEEKHPDVTALFEGCI